MSEQAANTTVNYLIEVRKRLLRALCAILCIFAVLFYFSHDLYALLAEPLLRYLPQDHSMIATEITSSFLTPLKLTLVCSILLAVPILLYELWGFIAPALYTHERKWVIPLLLLSTFLFFAGILFAYYVVFPLVFSFFINSAPTGVKVMPDISRYLDFALKLFFAFGCAFEVPIAVLLLVWTGVTTPSRLAHKRPYVVVLAFILGMLLTPPDVISQILLAIPLWLLFELGVFAARFIPHHVKVAKVTR